ncbi:MAG: acetate/propionate family kinase [Halioglobus sp.]|nr:acetate/propionate family kinase [Halioglobus sp.]
MSGTILALNVGSSSIKFAAYPAAGDAAAVLSGAITGIGGSARLETGDPAAAARFGEIDVGEDHGELIPRLLSWLADDLAAHPPVAVGHRVVHGGPELDRPVLIDNDVLETLQALAPLAPRHQPGNLAGVRAVAATRPDLPQVACFDTAFHRSMSRVARLFALPRHLSDEGMVRYGFHGLSYEYIASELPSHCPNHAEGRVIVAHLGHGASLCAMRERRSVGTTMGFTALDGLVMGKRPGALDPGVVLHLMQQKGMSVDEVSDLLNYRSGLLGVSGLSDDMQVLLDSGDPRAGEAVDLFVYRAVWEIGALTAAAGGLDALVFTAGIGEKSAAVRGRICEGLAWLGLSLDPAANSADAHRISSADSAVEVLVIPTDEERVIARHTRALCASGDAATR